MGAAYQMLPPLTPDEYAELRADIEANGVQVDVIEDEYGQIIDGHHRSRIAAELDVPCPRVTVAGFTDAEKRSMALRVNLNRRHLSRAQKRELIGSSLRADPQLSDRQHARRTGAHHTTVGKQREALQSTGEISQSDTRTSADGRERPSMQPATVTKLPPVQPDAAEAFIKEYLDSDDQLRTASFQAALAADISRARKGVLAYDVEEVAAMADPEQFDSLDELASSFTKFAKAARQHRGIGLRSVGGGKR